ncbi:MULTISPECIES: COG4315 family predicted lipoprotein [unclassified Streptomyces]|uniref:COG4315 family predicted lipoprotein n=1 Tax=unclassified Streptomyces TaxID=2593676 RepID=UPI002E230651|nr:hypothetical protein OG217_07765 [Streptomyces sp. NBC_01023]
MFSWTVRRMVGRRTGVALATAAGGALLLSACGGGGSQESQKPEGKPVKKPSASAEAGGTAGHAELASRKTGLGTVLTDGKGFALYTFDKDSTGTSACSGKCADLWPPTAGTPHAVGSKELPGTLGHFTRADGTVQASYNGKPVYRFAMDTKPGQTNGEGVKGAWHVVKLDAGK